MNNNIISVPISLGELWDKYTILKIKRSKIDNIEKLKYIDNELNLIEQLCKQYSIDDSYYYKLLDINNLLWNIEDKIRDKEKKNLFDSEFISIARSVYKNNDIRASIKLEINKKYNSFICEVKDY